MGETVKGFVIAGSASGVGKTTVSLALMAALRKRGLNVQPFKCGPDFIDPGHHTRVCGRPSHNLDGWLLSPESNRNIFFQSAVGSDICIVEGVMGLFDGLDGISEAGSTAQIAKWLGLPIVLVIDASSISRSVAALVHGFETFDPQLKFAGVIFNRAAGPGHFRLLREALGSGCRAIAFGYLPPDERTRIPERHLGLITAAESPLSTESVSLLAELAEANIDLEKLLGAAGSVRVHASASTASSGATVRVGVARDRAFCFYYDVNLMALRAAGAEVIEFSPIEDLDLPEGLNALYLGGGYPELYAEQLGANRGMLSAIRRFADQGRLVYAECGGLMYLGEEIVTREGRKFPMVGSLPLRVQMTDRLVNFGYMEVSFMVDCPVGRAGSRARGHSFHHSTVTCTGPMERVYRLNNCLTGGEESEGYLTKNILASYVHLHFLSNSQLARLFVENARRAKHARFSKRSNAARSP